MEAEDESTGYFKLFNDGPHNNYLLQSSEDGLNDVESIFGLTADWSTEALPILFSGPLIADGSCVIYLKIPDVIFCSFSE